TVRGRVVDAQSGEPIGGATVDIRDRDGARFTMRTYLTDPSGLFIAENIGTGEYNVVAEKEGYGSKIVELTLGDSPAEVEVKLSPNPGITIRVVDARDGRALLPYIRILDMQNRVIYEPPPRFGGAGVPEVTKIGLEPGTYRAVVSAQGYATRNITVNSPGSHDVALTPGGSILIRSRGNELRRARLMGADGRVYSRNIYTQTFTIDPSPGVTELENIAPGSYTLQVLGPKDEVLGSTQVVVSEAQRAVVEF
ncbi:MAG TPA: carboxypeptidase-like regulatory domain-containing protein, partial [Thermoanaerobaculia bacterium]|nr:carboxypeptidase-like regulatory domain-containing protein [Thermoanaerobaculia bacterium]